ncbi:type II toxin-antitoxin system VapC family toxin [uncultured Hymenobacter sp.]|uniref:type II toxin-antitoxin system VapC family toxin n=1 Tax=uncultured Hymenobacter sp. TaxID=170016 RepID=UPI0035C9F663
MRAFFDTSSLIKLYHAEVGSAELRAQLSTSTQVIVTQLTWVESTSSFGRVARRGALTNEQAATALALLRHDWRLFEVVDITAAHYAAAAVLVERHQPLALRSLDAIQLAAALAAGPLDAFFTHDERLRQAARAEGLPVR